MSAVSESGHAMDSTTGSFSFFTFTQQSVRDRLALPLCNNRLHYLPEHDLAG
jgi:hypothetical protein